MSSSVDFKPFVGLVEEFNYRAKIEIMCCRCRRRKRKCDAMRKKLSEDSVAGKPQAPVINITVIQNGVVKKITEDNCVLVTIENLPDNQRVHVMSKL